MLRHRTFSDLSKLRILLGILKLGLFFRPATFAIILSKIFLDPSKLRMFSGSG